jgi:hypothetical protein
VSRISSISRSLSWAIRFAGEPVPVGGGTEDTQADQTHFLERTVTDSLQLDVLSMTRPTEIEQRWAVFSFDDHGGWGIGISGCPLQGQQWTANTDSYGAGWFSIVLKNTSDGDLCIDDVDGTDNGAGLAIEGCNGTAKQAWRGQCVYTANDSQGLGLGLGLETVNPLGMAIDLYGDHYQDYDPIVAWGAESSGPDAELLLPEFTNDVAFGTCRGY